MNQLIKKSTSVLLLFFFLPACTQLKTARETAIIKKLVINYNKGLINAARTGDVTLLKNLASEDVLRKLYFWITAWGDSGLYMDAEMKNIEFKNVTISGEEAKVVTSEKWIYVYKNIKKRQVAIPTSHISYEMEYILHKKDKQKNWIITVINIKSEKKKEGSKE